MEKVNVKCGSCIKVVEVEPVAYGLGYIGVCPICDKLAFSSDEIPQNIEEIKKGK